MSYLPNSFFVNMTLTSHMIEVFKCIKLMQVAVVVVVALCVFLPSMF